MKKLAEKHRIKCRGNFFDKLSLRHISSLVSGQVGTQNIFYELVDKGEGKGERKISSETRVIEITELSCTGFREESGSKN